MANGLAEKSGTWKEHNRKIGKVSLELEYMARTF